MSFQPMTWKLYALLSGAAFVGTYLVSGPAAIPHARPQTSRVTVPQSAPASTVETDIQVLADRLESHVRGDTTYHPPTRNPFTFGQPHLSARPVTSPKVAELPPPPPIPVGPSVKLSGIAEDRVNGVLQRTAIFSGPMGVLLAREGETVDGSYRIVSIDENAVTLERASDGTSLRLSLSRP
jgi:hypothetical protein